MSYTRSDVAKMEKSEIVNLLNDLETQVEQCGVNIRYLLESIDHIHNNLCPDDSGTWQQRVEQAKKASELFALAEKVVEAAEKVRKTRQYSITKDGVMDSRFSEALDCLVVSLFGYWQAEAKEKRCPAVSIGIAGTTAAHRFAS